MFIFSSGKVSSAILLPILFIVSTMGIVQKTYAETPYTIGVVPQFEARKLRSIWNPIINELEKETGLKFQIQGSSTIPAFEKEFNAGKFDIAYMNPYHIVLANRNQGYLPIVRDVGRKLYGILVVSSTGGINKIEDLNKKLLAFPAPNALGASLLIRAALREKFKIDFEEVYVKSHSSTYLNVALGQAQAGGGVQKTLKQQKLAVQKRLKVLYETEKVAPHPIAIHPRIPKEHVKKITSALLKIGKSENGKKLLSKIPIKVIGKATIEDYLPLEKMGLDKYYINP